MVSIRLSWEEYRALQDACTAAGVRSLSELARGALQQLLSSRHNGMTLFEQVCELRDQLGALSREVERIDQRVDRQDQTLTTRAAAGGST